MKDETRTFDLYKFMGITTVIAIVLALLFQIDYTSISAGWESFIQWYEKPFEWTQGAYGVVLLLLLLKEK